MATIPRSGIIDGQIIEAFHVTQIIDGLDGTGTYEILATGSFTGSGFIESASYALTASNINALNQDVVLNGNVTINGTASITFLNVAYESASVIYSSGSNQLGDATDDTQTLIGTTILSGSLQVTGSTYIPDLTGSLYGTASWAETASWAVSASQAITASYALNAGIPSLNNNLLTNKEVGGIPFGTNYPIGTAMEDILRQMLITYLSPTLTALSMRNGGTAVSPTTRDVNNSFTVNTASFSATTDNPNGNYPYSASWTASGADIGTQLYYFGDNVLAGSNIFSVGSDFIMNRATTAGSITFTVRGKKSGGDLGFVSVSQNVSFLWRNYFAASTASLLADAQDIVNNDLVTSQLDTDKAWSVTCNAANNDPTKYTYIIYPSSFGLLSNIVRNSADAVLSAFNLGVPIGTTTINNLYGAGVSCYVYRTNAPGAFGVGNVLAIT